MLSNKILLSCIWLIICVTHLSAAAVVSQINCQRPPKLVDPALCCQDGGPDVVTENCAKRLGINDQSNDRPPTIETATCLAECILQDSLYMQGLEKLNISNIRNQLTQKFSNDSSFIDAMVSAYEKCEPHAQSKMREYRQLVPPGSVKQIGCSPFASILLGCTYMEYFKNCPAQRWTQNAECTLAKQYVRQCMSGA